MKEILSFVIVLSTFFLFNTTHAQSSRFIHEAGVSLGTAVLQTDFGEQKDFSSSNASTFSFGLNHYLKFFGDYSWDSRSSYFAAHYKLKSEFNYTSSVKLEHKGSLVEGEGVDTDKLKAMTGEVKMYNIGTNLEYYFLEIDDYSSFYRSKKTVNPFLSIGLHYTFYDPDILVNGVSLEGQQEPYTELIDKWQEDAIYLQKGSTFGASVGAGLRLSLDRFDLVLDGRWQHFFSDKVDGLDDFSGENQASNFNDTMVYINFGIVYVFRRN